MTREELIGVNAGIVKDVVSNVLKYSPDAILVIISNPMDTMTYLVRKHRAFLKIELSEWEEFWTVPVLKPI